MVREVCYCCPTCGGSMATAESAGRRLSFDVFELDVHAGELRKRGVKLRLQGQPLQVLAILLNRAGDVVTRDEIRGAALVR